MTEIEKKAELNWEMSVSISGDLSEEQIYKEGYKDGYEQGLYDKHADREEDIIHLSKENAELKAENEKLMERIKAVQKICFDSCFISPSENGRH